MDRRIYQTLRLASAMCFIGHGAFGIITKPIWCNYFAVFGIGQATAYKLMPFVGGIDILFGIFLLVYPLRFFAGWLLVWGIVTALLRPISGEPFAEFIERAGNFGAPLALLLTGGLPARFRDWFSKLEEPSGQALVSPPLLLCLKIAAFLLLAGHGWLNLIAKPGLIAQYTALGFSNPVNAAKMVGSLELLAACSILVKPLRPVVLVLFCWKMFSELFYPHWELFEWIERGGSYGILLSLWFALGRKEAVTQLNGRPASALR